jgi:molybdopterin converting factor subunit 1
VRVNVLCFARLREMVGRSEFPCEVPPASTIADVWQVLVAACPDAAAMSSSVSCALNAEFASMSAPVTEGDEVAFLPPVSGGAPRGR